MPIVEKIKSKLGRNHDDANTVNHNNVHNTAPLAHTNPLDRNHDGRVDMHDLTGRPANNILAPGMTQTTTATTTAGVLPLADRNGDGIIDSRDNLVAGNRLSQGYVATGMPLADRNGDGIIDSRDNLVAGNRLSQGYVATGMPLADRNGDGIIDSRDSLLAGNRLSQGYEGAYVQSAQRASLVRAEPTVIETIQKDVVIQERIHPVEKEEIQPIIYREREQLDVKQVTQMMHETQIQPTLVEQRELAAEIRAPIVERGAPIAENIILPSTQRDATLRTQEIHAPIVEEIIKKTVIEEIQPVLERDVFVPTVVQHTQPIYEKIVEAPTVYREVREVRELGTRSVEMSQPFVQPVIAREVPIVAPVVAPIVPVAPIVEHVTMSTTTTTTDSFIPAKMVQEGELRNFQPAAANVAPVNTRRV